MFTCVPVLFVRILHRDGCVSFFLDCCDDFIHGEFGLVIFDGHLLFVVTGVYLLDSREIVFDGFEFHRAVGAVHVGDGEGLFFHSNLLKP